jgi:hypothetical protein
MLESTLPLGDASSLDRVPPFSSDALAGCIATAAWGGIFDCIDRGGRKCELSKDSFDNNLEVVDADGHEPYLGGGGGIRVIDGVLSNDGVTRGAGARSYAWE